MPDHPLDEVPVQPLPQSGDPVPLNQPFPKELNNAPIVKVAEDIGQAVVSSEDVNQPDKQPPSPAASPLATPSEQKAPRKDGRWAISNPIVKLVVVVGTIMVIVGLIMLFVTLAVGIILILIGGGAVAAGVFLPIGMNRKPPTN